MELIRTGVLPFSDYVIFYFVDMFGVEWLAFYHYILVAIFALAIAGWVFAIRMYFNCDRDIKIALEKECVK
ncbi:hypothetical protein SMGD1_0268 [Sulfurimonas gotlandica GD1]|uniref:Uncharacterized protein n=1 Tax=Sulfurimonas gotlandica (strain DSM 19862 / JCM 16533 / GD1) TaxID=929558 RepID=H1FTL9_SULGG|nr:hypothetical protein [Sulfurimonas gotlandica]EHP28795.1 hypothetical protein SMGD1_0268 [Sulfurimonas gotlandica GD1]